MQAAVSASQACMISERSSYPLKCQCTSILTFSTLQAFVDSSPEQLQQIVSTNMVGTLLCTRAAMQVMQKQSGGGHIFNMDGAGADGMPTPQYAAYGATKAGMLVQEEQRQMCKSLIVRSRSPVSRGSILIGTVSLNCIYYLISHIVWVLHSGSINMNKLFLGRT